MRGLLSFVLALAFMPVATAASMLDAAPRLTIPANFEQCNDLQASYAEPLARAGFAGDADLSVWGSLTGFVDFALIDSLLRFLDEYVSAGLAGIDLRRALYFDIPCDMSDFDALPESLLDFYATPEPVEEP